METQSDQTQPSALPMTQHHYTTAEHLLDQENRAAAEQLPSSLTRAGSKSQGTGYHGTPAESLLHRETPSKQLPRWPSSPKPITTPAYIKALYVIFDVLLLSCSAAFLAFAVIVSLHDQDSTTEYPRLTRALLNATKYVLVLSIITSILKLTPDRAQLFSPYFSPQSLAARRTPSYSGGLKMANALAC
jgi:hypothetical protein